MSLTISTLSLFSPGDRQRLVEARKHLEKAIELLDKEGAADDGVIAANLGFALEKVQFTITNNWHRRF